MAGEYVKLGDLELSLDTGHNINLLNFPEPQYTLVSREYANKDGAEIVSKRYKNSVRTIGLEVAGSSKDNLYTLLKAIRTELNSADLVLEYKSNDASNSNYSDVLTAETGTTVNFQWVHNDLAQITLTLVCKPFWRAAQVTIAAQTLSPTPAKLTLGTIEGDVPAPCSIEIAGVGAGTFGANLRIGSRKYPILEANFSPVQDFGNFAKTVTDAWVGLTGESTNINGIAMESATVGVAVGDGGKIYTTADGGATVTERTSGTTQNLNSVVYLGTGDYAVCGNGGVILRSLDQGATWAAATSGTTYDLNACDFVSASTGWFVGDYGTILKTTDFTDATIGDVSFAAQTSPTPTLHILSIYAYDANTVYCGSYSGSYPAPPEGSPGWYPTLIKTVNGGTAWANVADNPGDGYHSWYTITGHTNADTVIVAGENGLMYKTTNGGTSWTVQTSGVTSNILVINMFSATVGWFAGASGVIRKTADGSTWTAQTSGTSARLNAIAVIDASNVFIAGDGFTIRKTTDGGTNWTNPLTTSVAWALSSAEDYKGRYEIWAYITKNAAGAGDARVSSGWAGGSFITNPSVAVAASASAQWVNLGEISVPATTLSDEVTAAPAIKLEGKLDTGSETWTLHKAFLFPVDGEAALTSGGATAASHIFFDSDKNACNQGATIVTWYGSPPMLLPGNNNIVVAESSGVDSCVVTVKYPPQYLLPVA